MIPLALAIIHSIVGLKFSQGVVSIVGNGSMMKYILITLLILSNCLWWIFYRNI